MTTTLDAALLAGWARAASAALERHSAAIDRINVFPVADGDTGTNLLLTMRSAVESLEDAAARAADRAAEKAAGRAATKAGLGDKAGDKAGDKVAEAMAEAVSTASSLARGALIGARGNSGVILSQVLRGVSDAIAAGAERGGGGAVLADALARAHRLATEAVARPREGTVLSVLSAAAVAARAALVVASDRLDAVAAAAADAARTALRQTTGQLPELARAGVVDAGGLGLFLVLDALAGLLRRPVAVGSGGVGADGAAPDERAPDGGAADGAGSAAVGATATGSVAAGLAAGWDELPGPADGLGAARGRDALTAERETGSAVFEYEVMYLLDAADDAAAALREELTTLGDSVAVVGDGAGLWNVHVHCTDIGAAVEAGLAVGRPRRITVVRFADGPTPPVDGFARARAVLLALDGHEEIAALAREAGVEVCAPGDVREAVEATRARHVVLLPTDALSPAAAEAAAVAARRDGREVQVLPASVLQALSAIAVHDPERRPADDVPAMADAAAHTRTGELLVAEAEALTWAGRCEPGDVLGLVDGEVVLIAPDLAVGALWLAHRMLTAGGEIVTALLGAGADPALGEGLAADLRRTHPEVDVVVHSGGPPGTPLGLAVE